jgi:hypothetical protein
MGRYQLVEKQSAQANAYSVVEDLMALSNVILNLAFYVYPTVEMAENGEKIGATGFFAGIKSDNYVHLYAVTNAHVLEQMRDLGVTEMGLRFNTKAGETDVIPAPLDQWVCHHDGDDVAVFPIEPSNQWRIGFLLEESFVTEAMLHKQLAQNEDAQKVPIWHHPAEPKWIEIMQIGVGDDTITPGRYQKHSGILHNFSAVRFGKISMLPYEPVRQEFRDFDQDSYLVETHSINGYSGSPVLTAITLEHHDGTSTRYDQGVPVLLGIDWGHFDFRGEIIEPKATGVKVPSGMMCVVPAWKLSELFHSGKLEMQRKELDDERRKKDKDGATMDTELTKEEFERVMERVTRKVEKPDEKRPQK